MLETFIQYFLLNFVYDIYAAVINNFLIQKWQLSNAIFFSLVNTIYRYHLFDLEHETLIFIYFQI